MKRYCGATEMPKPKNDNLQMFCFSYFLCVLPDIVYLMFLIYLNPFEACLVILDSNKNLTFDFGDYQVIVVFLFFMDLRRHNT